MRISYLSTFYPFRGGIAQFNAALLRALEKQNHTVNAYTFTTQYPSILFPGETQMVKEGDKVDIINSKRVLNSINPISYHKASQEIAKSAPDLLLMKFWMAFFGPSLGYVASKIKKRAKVISILDNVISHEPRFFDKAFTSYFLKHNTAYVAMSEKVKNDLLQFHPNAKVKIIPHPLYNHFGESEKKEIAKSKLGLNTKKKCLLFFGFIRDYKGLDILIKAFLKLGEDYQLLIAGETYGSFNKYDKLIEDSNRKTDIIKHIRYISDAEVSSFFSAADVCVLPYKSATQSGITGISYHFNLPIIATNVGGLAETVIHEKTGIIVPNSDENTLMNSIVDFFNKDYQDYIHNIKELKKKLSWEKFAEEIIKFSYDV